ncbi:hypothetical protein ACP4OV_019598 [Aristida adscensionis]
MTSPLDLWNHWATQILVLLSLTLQVVLLLLAGIRRREAPAMPKLVLWLAYQLADSTAIYAIGHLSLGATPREHRLVAFWAPFLVLHLGGPDSISAYALQDSQLWLRHLQIFVVQVSGAAYVLYKHAADGDPLLLLASALMFAVGVVKYVERIWALKCGNLDSIRSTLKKQPLARRSSRGSLPRDRWSMAHATETEEKHLRRAHSMFHVCRRAMVDCWLKEDQESQSFQKLKDLQDRDYDVMWALMEMELSLMYDLLYTKAAVIHTWPGYFVRAFSSLATAASLLLFQLSLSGRGSHSSVDIGVTYILLAGALLVETASLVSALGSSWTYAFLCATRWRWLRHAALWSGRWDRLRRLVKRIKRRGSSARRWSGKMGQFNMLHLCSRRDRACVPLLGKLAALAGQKEWWIRKYNTGTARISDNLRRWLFRYVRTMDRKGRVNTMGLIRNKWGQNALEYLTAAQEHGASINKRSGGREVREPEPEPKQGLYDNLKDHLGDDFQEAIIIMHIGTDVFLARSTGADAPEYVQAIRTLSNYLMFLLVQRPYMLPGLPQSMLYDGACEDLAERWEKNPGDRRNGSMLAMIKEFFRLRDDPNDAASLRQRDHLAKMLYSPYLYTYTVTQDYSLGRHAVSHANTVANILLENERMRGRKAVLELLLDVWMDYVVYAGNRCSRESHAKKLSTGGELTTVLWLMQDHLHQESNAEKDGDVGCVIC